MSTKSGFSYSKEAQYVEQVALFAEHICGKLQLGQYPVLSLARVLEDIYGAKLFASTDMQGAVACGRGEYGPFILIDGNESPTTQVQRIAHAVFHLLTWDTLLREQEMWDARSEHMADIFATSLLITESDVQGHSRISARYWRLLKQAYVGGQVSATRAAELVDRTYGDMRPVFLQRDEETTQAEATLDEP